MTATILLDVFVPLGAGLAALLTGWGAWVWRTSNGGRARRAARRAAKAEKPGVPWFLAKEEAAVPPRPLPAAFTAGPWRSGLYSWSTGEFKALVEQGEAA